MFQDWNKGVSCVGQLVQDVEVENVENDDGIEADNNQKFLLLFVWAECYILENIIVLGAKVPHN